jgi:hypothetical protein
MNSTDTSSKLYNLLIIPHPVNTPASGVFVNIFINLRPPANTSAVGWVPSVIKYQDSIIMANGEFV